VIDILLPLGPGSWKGQDSELRFCIRSIEKHAKNLRKVWVVGHCPSWLRETDTVRIAPRQEFDAPKGSRISLKVLWAFENLDMTNTVAFWNDDYLLTRRVDISVIPNFYSGKLWMARRTPWAALRRETHAALESAGLPTRNYDIHVPMLFERAKFLQLRDWWDKGYVGKSVYGNHFCESDRSKSSDCKLWRRWYCKAEKRYQKRFVISYGNTALKNGAGYWIEAKVPIPSKCEGDRE
jgi:hypothetical protein